MMTRSILLVAAAEPPAGGGTILATPGNFVRAESGRYFGRIAKKTGFGKFDLDAGPVTITLPDPGEQVISMQVIDEDQYTHAVNYKPGLYTLKRLDIKNVPVEGF